MMDKEYVGIRQATAKGYIECEVGGIADFSYPTSKIRRGRVQGGGHRSCLPNTDSTEYGDLPDRKI